MHDPQSLTPATRSSDHRCKSFLTGRSLSLQLGKTSMLWFHNVGTPFDSVQWGRITPISPAFVVVITIANWVINQLITRGPHIVWWISHSINCWYHEYSVVLKFVEIKSSNIRTCFGKTMQRLAMWKQQVEKRDSSTFQNTKEMDKSSAGFELLGDHKKSKSGEMNKLTILVRCHKFPLTFDVILHIGRSEIISYPQIHWGSPSRSHWHGHNSKQ